ncbi:pilus assembly protein PilM [Planctomycetota bacterium]
MKQSRVQLGIHISDHDLSLVAVCAQDDQMQMVAWQRVPLDDDWVKGGRIQNPAGIAQHLSCFLRKEKLHVEQTTLTLTLNVVRLKVAQFKTMSDEDLHDAVMQELERYTPYGRDNTYKTYQVLPMHGDDEGPTSVLQFMTSRNAGDQCLAVARRVGLGQLALEAGMMPLLRCLNAHQTFAHDAVSLLCVFDGEAGMLCVLLGHNLVFCQTITLGMQDIVADRDCVEVLGQVCSPVVEYARSLSDKRLTLLVAANGTYDELRTVVMRVRHSLHHVQVRQLSSVQMTKLFGIPRHPDNKELPILALAAALVPSITGTHLDPVNLIPPSSLEKLTAKREVSHMGVAIIAVVLLAVAAVVPLNMKTKRVEAQSAAFESQIAAARPIQDKMQAARNEIRTLEKKVKAFTNGTQQIVVLPWHRLMTVLAERAPVGLRLMEFDTRPNGEFSLIGEALNEAVVHEYAQALDVEAMIEDTEVEEIQYDHQAVHTVEYKMTARLVIVEPNKP